MRDSPSDGDQYAACAGTLLLGKALIIGGGRCVAVKSAMLCNRVSRIHVVDKNFDSVSNLPNEFFNGGVFIHKDINLWRPDEVYESMFYDPWPPNEALNQVLTYLAKENIITNGRIIVLGWVFSPNLLPDWEVSDRIAPVVYAPNSEVLRLKRKL